MSAIEGKIVAITGASGGIGAATALLLAERGAKVVLGGQGSDKLQALAQRITDAGGEAVHAVIDVTKRDDLAGFVATAQDRFGKLDVLFSNAGIGPLAPMDDLKVDEWDAMIDVNIRGVIYGIAAALPVFHSQGFGHFIHTASTAGLKTVPNQAVYSGTKFAVRAISEGLRQEIAEKRLRVTVITPGMVKTDFINTTSSEALKGKMAQSRDAVGMGPGAVASAVAYAIEQPDDIDIGEMVVRPTAQA
jgi:NADP-dependent 3-hydroxy acid dehydrogenase YdfG